VGCRCADDAREGRAREGWKEIREEKRLSQPLISDPMD
jgi:hypothetical protein